MINLSSINLAGAGGTGGGGGSHTATFPDVTIYGQPTINGSQISNFSAQNYLQLPFVVDFAGRPWQIDFAFTTGTDVQTQQNILDSRFGLAFAIAQGKLEIALSSDGTSWNLGAHFGTLAITPETSYKVRMTFDDTQYEVKVSTNGSDYASDIVVTSTESLAPKQMLIGVSPGGSHVFGGSVNLAHATLIISGKPVWQGMTEVGNATRLAIDLSNIDAEGKQKINDIVSDGIVGNPNNLDESIKADNLVASLNKVAGYMQGKLENIATGIVLEESSNPAWTRLGNKTAIDRVINEHGAIVVDPVHKMYAHLSDYDLNTFADGTPWAGTYGEAIRHFAPLHFIVKNDEAGRQIVWGSHEDLDGHTFVENFVGCYQGSVGADGALHSRPNVAVTTSKTMTAFWNAAQVLGTDWGLMNYFDHQKMILMHLLHFGTANSDETMGTGLNTNPSGGSWYNYRTGSCALKGIYTGSLPHSENESFKQCHLFGVEGLAGGSWEFRPNIRFDGVNAIVYEGNIVSNTAEGRVFQRDPNINLSSSYIKKMALGEHFDVIPVEGGGDSSHYWCDGAWSAAGGQLLRVGGWSNLGSLCGLAASNSSDGFSNSYAYLGARLAFHGSLDEFELVSGQALAAAQA